MFLFVVQKVPIQAIERCEVNDYLDQIAPSAYRATCESLVFQQLAVGAPSKHFQCFSDFHDYTNVPNQSKSWFNNAEKKYENIFCIKNNDHSLWRVYDSTVGNRTIKGPDRKGKYSIINIHEVSKQLIVTWGENFNECYEILLLFENVKPLCIVNCLNYGDPKNCLFDLKTTIDDLTEKCKKYNIPIVGGNVSLYNSTNNNCIKPTPILVMIGICN